MNALRNVAKRSLSSGKNFQILGLQQIAIGSLDKSQLTALWSGTFGIEKVGDYVSEKENVDEDILRLGKGAHAVEIDLMTPLNPDKAPKVHVPALNHIGLWVDDIHTAVKVSIKRGVH